MTTPGAEVFCDTNVLVAAVDAARPTHSQALELLDRWPRGAVTLCVSAQVLREFLVVSTRPVAANGLGLPLAKALDNVRAVVARTRLLDERGGVAQRLLDIVAEAGCTGKQIHDANIVATMLEHGVRRLLTDNLEDFARYPSIELVDLARVTVSAIG